MLHTGDWMPLRLSQLQQRWPGVQLHDAWRPCTTETQPAFKAHYLTSQLAERLRCCLQGRFLRPGDQLPLGKSQQQQRRPGVQLPEAWRPAFPSQGSAWTIGVLPGPNAAPDYFTPEDIDTLHSSAYEVHYNSYAPLPYAPLLVHRLVLALVSTGCSCQHPTSCTACTAKGASIAGWPQEPPGDQAERPQAQVCTLGRWAGRLSPQQCA